MLFIRVFKGLQIRCPGLFPWFCFISDVLNFTIFVPQKNQYAETITNLADLIFCPYLRCCGEIKNIFKNVLRPPPNSFLDLLHF